MIKLGRDPAARVSEEAPKLKQCDGAAARCNLRKCK